MLRTTLAGRLALLKRQSSGARPSFREYSLKLWGSGGSGEIGRDWDALESHGLGGKGLLAPNEPLSGVEDVKYAACGMNHTLVLREDGKVLAFGNATNGKLGLGSGVVSEKKIHEPRLIDGLVDIRTVACGDYHSAAVDSSGKLYTWGFGGSFFSVGYLGLGGTQGDVNEPKLVNSVAEVLNIVDVSAGSEHTVALTDDGEVWVCGEGEYGRMGTGNSSSNNELMPVLGLEDRIVKQIAAGHSFTLALTSEGEVFGWGRGESGQIGVGGALTMDIYKMELLPVQVRGFDGQRVIKIAAGETHSLAITEKGDVFMWGNKEFMEPERVVALNGVKIIDIGAGQMYSACLSDQGELYTFGAGRRYGVLNSFCLGHGNSKTVRQAKRVEALDGQFVKSVFCGKKHMAVLV